MDYVNTKQINGLKKIDQTKAKQITLYKELKRWTCIKTEKGGGSGGRGMWLCFWEKEKQVEELGEKAEEVCVLWLRERRGISDKGQSARSWKAWVKAGLGMGVGRGVDRGS